MIVLCVRYNFIGILLLQSFYKYKDTKTFLNLPTFSTLINTFVFSYADKTPTYSNYIRNYIR